MLTVLTRYSPYREIIKPTQFHDLGKLMLAFVMLFAYFSFSQWLIIWSGNLPEEIGWYLNRIRGGWGVVALIIILFHFALALRAAAVARAQTRRPAPHRHRRVPHVHAAGRHLLVRRTQLCHERGHFYLSIWYISGAARCGRRVADLLLL